MRAASALSPMLQRLATERATGALMRDRGTLYLADGQVVHAESPATPGIDILLTTGGTLHRDGWWDAVAQAGAGQRVGRYLVDSGRIPGGALELCHVGALYDAAFFALAPTRTPARFRYGVSHWIGPVHPVPVDAVQRETLRRRELLDRIWPDATTDTAPLVRAAHPVDTPVPARRLPRTRPGGRSAYGVRHRTAPGPLGVPHPRRPAAAHGRRTGRSGPADGGPVRLRARPDHASRGHGRPRRRPAALTRDALEAL